jgi:hypothetical protein
MPKRKAFAVFSLLMLPFLRADDPASITDAMRARFWRAQTEYIAASAQAQKAKVALDAAHAELQKACGDRQVIAGQDGEPTCAPKSEKPKDGR